MAAALIPSFAQAVTIDELCRDYTPDVAVAAYYIFGMSGSNYEWYQPTGYTMTIEKGNSDNAVVIKKFVP